MSEMTVVGAPVRRVDAREKVTGRARFISDLRVPGMVHAKLWRSPVPHARLRRVNAAAAREAPGVLAVLTADDLADCDRYYGPAFKDQPILAHERIRYAGEPVAAVVAESEAAALAALPRLDVGYEELPAVTTLEAALAPGAPCLHETLRPAGTFRDLARLRPVPGTNICHHYTFRRGDVARGFAEADLILEDTFTFPMVHHYSMEAHVAMARWDGDEVTLWASTQHPFPVRREIAEMFGLPLARVQVIVPYLGGAYGNKSYTKLEPLTVALARRVGRPVRLALTAEEGFKSVRRAAARTRLKTGARRDGTLVARECEVHFQLGAYADVGPRVVQKAGYTAGGPYRIPHLAIDAYAVYTNTVTSVAFRGYGVPQLAWAYESQMDMLAERLGLDPLEIRAKNLLKRGETFVDGDLPIDADLEGDLRKAAAAIGWPDRPSPQPSPRRGEGEDWLPSPRRGEGEDWQPPPQGGGGEVWLPARPGREGALLDTLAPHGGEGRVRGPRGKGLACVIKAPLAPSVSSAMVRMHADGSATLLTGSVEFGQGARTALSQIVAQELALPLERIRIGQPEHGMSPYDQATSASRSTTLMGLAVQRAARDVRDQLLGIGSAALGVPPAAVRLEAGRLVGPDRALAFAEAIARHFGMPGGELIGRGSYRGEQGHAPLGGVAPFWEIGMAAAEVEVDPETGGVTVLRYVSVADVGKAINPLQCEAQEEGGVMMGIGHSFFEQMVYQDGQLVNPSLLDYRVPAMTDLPGELRSLLVENADGPGPYGAKGIGESGLLPTAPAIANAIAAAAGVRLTDLPLTPERVWMAVRKARP
jgi:CO/xanthine dehydrogenase Mo-binding subunit